MGLLDWDQGAETVNWPLLDTIYQFILLDGEDDTTERSLSLRNAQQGQQKGSTQYMDMGALDKVWIAGTSDHT
jgi:hypothetical protein